MIVMKRWKLACSLLAAASLLPAQTEESQLDTDIRLFAVMAAINVAGYDDGINSTAGSPVREAVRKELEDFDGSTLPLLRNFYQQFCAFTPAAYQNRPVWGGEFEGIGEQIVEYTA